MHSRDDLRGEILDGESDSNPLELGFVESGVSEGGSALWYAVAVRSLIIKSVVPLVRGCTIGDPLSCSSIAGVLTSLATGVMPSGGSANCPRNLCSWGVGCAKWWQ
jgi:hypothetical protein